MQFLSDLFEIVRSVSGGHGIGVFYWEPAWLPIPTCTWANANGRASEISSTFIPEYEFPGVSAALEGFDPFYFSMRTLSVLKNKDDIIARLNVLADSYASWIQEKLFEDSKMECIKKCV